MATFGSNGIVLTEVKTFAFDGNITTPLTIYSVPAGRYGRVSIQFLSSITANNLDRGEVQLVSGTTILTVIQNYISGANRITLIAAGQTAEQFTVASGIAATYNMVNNNFLMSASDSLTITTSGGQSVAVKYHIVVEEYLLP